MPLTCLRERISRVPKNGGGNQAGPAEDEGQRMKDRVRHTAKQISIMAVSPITSVLCPKVGKRIGDALHAGAGNVSHILGPW